MWGRGVKVAWGGGGGGSEVHLTTVALEENQ